MSDDKTAAEDENKAEAPENEKESVQDTLEADLVEVQELTGDDLKAALENALAEVEEFKDQTLRAKAETENMRKRVSRDVEKAHKFALEKFASNLLPVVDSLEKAVENFTALEAADGEEASQNTALSGIEEGVVLALKLFLDTLQRSGIKQVDPEGEPFDPQFHEAMGMLESEEVEPGSVIKVLQKGYTLNDRLVRAAMVMVSKEPAKA